MIGNGIPNPLMLAGGDPLDELGKIDRSLRFRSAASADVRKTFGAVGSQSKWAWGAWLKRGSIKPEVIYGAVINSQNYATIDFGFLDSDTDCLDIVFAAGNVIQARLKTNAVFRDTASHCHIYLEIDTAHATASERMRLWINGVRVTVFLTAGYPAQNANLPYINGANEHRIGGASGYSAMQYDGPVSNVVFVDGQNPGVTAVGQFHPRTGQWRPKSRAAVKAVVDAGGVNSFFLPFDDATNLTTLSADASSKGNNFTATNISLTAGATYDSLLDTPTANYATLDGLCSFLTLSNGNLQGLSTDTVNERTAISSMSVSSGKWYAEFVLTLPSGGTNVSTNICVGTVPPVSASSRPSALVGGVGYRIDGQKEVAGAVSAYGTSYIYGDVLGIALDLDNSQVTFYRNNVSQGALAITPGLRYFMGASLRTTSGSVYVDANFGQRPFAYTPPSGFKALNTKNLPIKPAGPMKSTDAFVAVTDTGANIASTLAAARSGWPAYIDIIKRRDTTEGWRWIFSDDPGYYMDTSSAAAKAAVPAFGGTAYIGFSLKVSALNGVATGRLVHANGVADSVTDGLGNSRKAIILVNEAGSNWFFYHPDLTAGKLLYLNQTTVETTDSTIGSVNSTGFTVAAALPSGTYRWIALAEVDGFLRVGKHTGNGSTDGTFDNKGFTPAFELTKPPANGTTGWFVFDSKHEAGNVETSVLYANTTAGDATGYTRDSVSNGRKWRFSAGDPNTSGASNISVSFAAFPFRYANAR